MIASYRTRLLSTAIVPLAALASASAFAQTTDDTAAADATVATEEIVVTGSLIRNPNLELSVPVNVTTADAIELKQLNVAEEVLRELPGVVPNIGSAVNNGNTGVSRVDLRGLGANRNIVLLDGHRIVPDDAIGVVDLNGIPLALVDRVDALTGAAVTTYGADAVTGVVNFVLKRDFAGIEASASEQITERGDGNTFRVDATIGANFDDGRGNATLNIGYQEADAITQGARGFSTVQIDSFSGGALGSSTAVPSRFSGTRPLVAGTNTPNFDPTVLNGGTRQINAAGAAVAPFTTFNFNPFNLFQTPFKRFNIFGSARYEVSDDVEVYARGLYSKNRVTTIVAPSGAFGTPVQINLNNPFLPSTLRNQFCAFDVNPTAVYTPRFSQAECDAGALASGSGDPAYRVIGTGGNVPFDIDGNGTIDPGESYNGNPAVALGRRSVEFGPRVSEFVVNTFDYRVGARGALTSNLDWDINASYGETDNTLTQNGFTVSSRLRQGLLVNGTRAAPVCQNTASGCVPLDVFGVDTTNPGTAGLISPAARSFATAESSAFRGARLAQVQGIVSGELGAALPSASEPVSVAVGGEYRNYSAYQAADFLSSQAGELGGAGGAILSFDGGYEVYEGFGEIVAPLIEDKAFFESLTLEAGARYSSYTVDAPGKPSYDTWTYKGGGSWAPGAGVRLRGNYSRASRAPNIFELFNPPATGLTNLGVDPCAGSAPTTNANLRAVCIAQGAPIGTIGSITNPTAAQANITTSGNLNLKPEKADTYTVGIVLQPEFVRGFNLSVDYYNIKVKDAVGAPLPGDLISACFGSITAASATNPACTIIRRNSLTGALDGDPSISPGLFAQQSNLGVLETSGADLIANYRLALGEADLAFTFVGNWTRSSKFKATPSAINRECAGYYSVNCSFTGSIQPEFQFTQRTTLSLKDGIDLSLLWRFVDSVRFEPQQLADDRAAADAANRGAGGTLLPVDLARIGQAGFQGCPNFETTDDGACMIDEEFRRIKAEHYFDLTGRWNINDNLTLTVTVQNLLDNKPKIVGNTIGSTVFNSGNTYPSTYDARGRRFAVSGKLRF